MSSNEPVSESVALSPRVGELVRLICERNPPHTKHLDSVLPRITAEEFEHLDRYLDFCIGRDLTLEYLAESYLLLVADAVNELIHFATHGNYRYSTFEEVADLVYFNDEYMSRYMHGLAISLIFWTSHRETHRFFDQVLPRERKGRYLEIGPGHGTFLMTAMRESSYTEFSGIDISETSIAQTRAILDHYIPEPERQCSLIVQDFFASDLQPASFDAIVMGEVLEHVEEPRAFLRKIHELARDDAFIFITTCVNAPQIDHIYLFRTLDEVADMLNSEGFAISRVKPIPYEGKTLDQCVAEQLPINVAYVLAKR